MTRVLVTGGAGFIGKHLVRFLLEKGYDVRVYDLRDPVSTKWAAERTSEKHIQYVQGDVRDGARLSLAFRGVDSVIHLAAQTSVQRSIRDPMETHSTNVTGTVLALRAARVHGLERFVLASSASVYGRRPPPNSEGQTPDPLSPYGASKVSAESYAMSFDALGGPRCVALRFTNVYGPGSDCRGEKDVVTSFAISLAKGTRPLIYGDGNQTRDFIHVRDVCSATTLALESRLCLGKIINIGTGMPTSVSELLRMMLALEGKQVRPQYLSSRKGDIRDSYASVDRARLLLNFRPSVTLRRGLASLF